MNDVELEYQYSEASRKIHNNRCHLIGILVTPKDDQKTYADVYDGQNATQQKVMRVRTGNQESKFIEFSKPLLMQRGIYVYIPDKVESFTVFWTPIED